MSTFSTIKQKLFFKNQLYLLFQSLVEQFFTNKYEKLQLFWQINTGNMNFGLLFWQIFYFLFILLYFIVDLILYKKVYKNLPVLHPKSCSLSTWDDQRFKTLLGKEFYVKLCKVIPISENRLRLNYTILSAIISTKCLSSRTLSWTLIGFGVIDKYLLSPVKRKQIFLCKNGTFLYFLVK